MPIVLAYHFPSNLCRSHHSSDFIKNCLEYIINNRNGEFFVVISGGQINHFLVACVQLYKPLRWLVSWLVCWLVAGCSEHATYGDRPCFASKGNRLVLANKLVLQTTG